MDKWDYVESIVSELKGTTDYNFQVRIGEVLKEYYIGHKKLTYEMPNSSGGDDKNDGWVLEEKLFFQIYSPQQIKTSLRKDVQDKFSEDLDKLLNLIYNSGKWNGELKEFVFIVNTIDRNLPHDSSRYYETEKIRLQTKYNIQFSVKVVNVDFIRGLLLEMNIENLRNLSSLLRITSRIDYNALTLHIFYELIDILSEGIHLKYRKKLSTTSNDYTRISTPEKISLNDLDGISEDIEQLILDLHILDEMINDVYQNLEYTEKLERIILYIIEEYKDLAVNHKGVALYNKLIDKLTSFTSNKTTLLMPAELLVVYTFDKCDIFEKEKIEV